MKEEKEKKRNRIEKFYFLAFGLAAFGLAAFGLAASGFATFGLAAFTSLITIDLMMESRRIFHR